LGVKKQMHRFVIGRRIKKNEGFELQETSAPNKAFSIAENVDIEGKNCSLGMNKMEYQNVNWV